MEEITSTISKHPGLTVAGVLLLGVAIFAVSSGGSSGADASTAQSGPSEQYQLSSQAQQLAATEAQQKLIADYQTTQSNNAAAITLAQINATNTSNIANIQASAQKFGITAAQNVQMAGITAQTQIGLAQQETARQANANSVNVAAIEADVAKTNDTLNAQTTQQLIASNATTNQALIAANQNVANTASNNAAKTAKNSSNNSLLGTVAGIGAAVLGFL